MRTASAGPHRAAIRTCRAHLPALFSRLSRRAAPRRAAPRCARSDDDALIFENALPATIVHPETGETLWFNGIHTNHRDYFDLAPHIDTADGSPFDTFYADGGEIEPDTLAKIRGSMWGRAVAVALQSGDVVVVDNRLAAHGRIGWTPGVPRKMLLNHFE